MKRNFFLTFFFISGVFWVFPQSNQFVDGVLASKKITYAQTAYLVLAAADKVPVATEPAKAFAAMQNLGLVPKGKKAEDSVDMETYAYTLMQAFKVPGGIMYTLFPSARYAYKELIAMQIMPEKSDPGRPVNGYAAIRMLGQVSDLKGGAK